MCFVVQCSREKKRKLLETTLDTKSNKRRREEEQRKITESPKHRNWIQSAEHLKFEKVFGQGGCGKVSYAKVRRGWQRQEQLYLNTKMIVNKT